MNASRVAALAILSLILLKWVVQLWLERLNQRSVLAQADAVPEAFREMIDESTYAKSVQYTLAQSRFSQFEMTYHLCVLVTVLYSGVLPWGLGLFSRGWGLSAWAMAAFLLFVGVTYALAGLPCDWHAQFHLEERFGFNTTTPKVWWLDRLKGLALAVLLGYPLLVLILKSVEWAGSSWWLWSWATVLVFQLLLTVLAPVLILPLFNKFTPLPEGGLRQRLWNLAQRTGFRLKGIQVMDGSRRSRHSNAFFTGFGRFRRIILFDTLTEQLTEPELEAVVAHEIGHCKLKHIPRLTLSLAVSLFAGFYAISWLAEQDWFQAAFGFPPGRIAPALLLFSLLSSTVTFWLSPLANLWTRRYEYQADGFAADAMQETDSLVAALRKLNEKNLSNLTPHPIYSGFYYSHPTLLERERALAERRVCPASPNQQGQPG